jgi:hypothetical protein
MDIPKHRNDARRVRINSTSRVPYCVGVCLGKRCFAKPHLRIADAVCRGERGFIETLNRDPDVVYLSSKPGLMNLS